MKQHGSRLFLDIKISLGQNELIPYWYESPTSSGRMIHFVANLPHYKIKCTTKTFINEVIDSSHQKYHEQNYICKVHTHTSEKYLPQKINCQFNTRRKKLKNNWQCKEHKKDNTYISVQYISKLRDQICIWWQDETHW